MTVLGPTDFVNEPDDRKAIGKVTGELPEEAYSLFRNDPVEDPELLKTASVVYRINDNVIPPIMICHGNKDRTVPYRQSERLYETLLSHNKEVLLYTVDGGGHGVDFWSETLIREIIRFVKETV